MKEKFIKGWDLAYFQSGEWQVVEEKLNDLEKRKHTGMAQYNPARANLFAALAAVPLDSVRVCIMGADPYPKHMHAIGIAFSIPPEVTVFPPTLTNLFKEYSTDLHYPTPSCGDLTPWVKQGVLLWNVYPSCSTGKPASHHWEEWTYLTKEIVEKLDAKGTVVFCLLGGIAGHYADLVKSSPVIRTSHPSPLGANHGFVGSRIFTSINDKLVHLGQEKIDWRLPWLNTQ